MLKTSIAQSDTTSKTATSFIRVHGSSNDLPRTEITQRCFNVYAKSVQDDVLCVLYNTQYNTQSNTKNLLYGNKVNQRSNHQKLNKTMGCIINPILLERTQNTSYKTID